MEANVQTTEAATGDTNAAEHVDTTSGVPASKDIELQLGKGDDETAPKDPGKVAETKPEGDDQKTTPDLYVLPDLPKDVTISETDQTSLFELGKKHGLSQDAVNDIISEHIKVNSAVATAQAEAVIAQHDATLKDYEETLTKNWGDKKEANYNLVDKVVARFIKTDTLKEYIIGKQAEGSTERMPMHPELADMMLEIATVMSADTLEIGQTQTKKNRGMKDKFSDLNDKQY